METRLKICGLRRPEDAELIYRMGADRLGVIRYAGSPRFVSDEQLGPLLCVIPPERRVWVDVNPDPAVVEKALGLGFHQFQLHCPPEVAAERVAAWNSLVGKDFLWLAPKVAPGAEFPEHLLGFASGIVADTYSPHAHGGTGKTGDWGSFRRWRERWPETTWILAGGLKPENVAEAIAQTGADFVDVNSGIESAPAEKDPEKLAELFRVLRPALFS